MTVLSYMDDFDVVTGQAKVLGVSATETDATAIVLDQTCFYPKGGGQDWDTGTLTLTTSTTAFTVSEVRLDQEGIVHHIGAFESGAFEPGDSVDCQVDTDRRMINTKLHSGGHALDMAVDRLGLPWIPGKGAHYPHMSFVEYAGVWEPERGAEIRAQIEGMTNQIISTGGVNTIRFMPVEEMASVCRHVPENIPTNKPARVVIYGGNFGVPCGGTHVKELSDIGTLSITKIKMKDGNIRVSYSLS